MHLWCFASSVSLEVVAVSKAEQRLRMERVLQPTRLDCEKDKRLEDQFHRVEINLTGRRVVDLGYLNLKLVMHYKSPNVIGWALVRGGNSTAAISTTPIQSA